MFYHQVLPKERKFTIHKESVLLQQSTNTRNNTAATMESEIPLDIEDSAFHDFVDNDSLETAYTQQKLRLAKNWTEIRDKLYFTILVEMLLHHVQCFSCQFC